MTHNILKEKILNVSKSYIDLRNKIEKMLDNYCDHEGYAIEEYMMKVCNKCHKAFEDE